ncbi:MAG: hypothetical protein HC913_24010 [Microscillaceae bacterium]|nr:hypothetical protein [Microscillaceae bacterium]
MATYHVLNAQIARYEGREIKDAEGKTYVPIQNDVQALHELTASDMVDLAGRMVMKNGSEVFNFGKYKNKSVEEVFKSDPSYYDWMMKGDFSLDTKRCLTQIKLRGALNKK